MLEHLKTVSKAVQIGRRISAFTNVSGLPKSTDLVPASPKQIHKKHKSFNLTHTKTSVPDVWGKFITLDVITDLVGLAGLQKDWNDLFAKCCTLNESHMGHAWHYSRCTALQGKLALAGYSGLAIVVGRYEGQVVLIWPMAVYEILGLRQLKWIGEATKEYCDVLLVEHQHKMEWLERAYAFVQDRIKPDLISLKNTRQTSAVADMLKQKGAFSHIPLKVTKMDWHGDVHWDNLGKRPIFSGSFKIRRKRRLSDMTSSYGKYKHYNATKHNASKELIPLIADHEQNVTICDYSMPVSGLGYAYTCIMLMAMRAGL